MDEYATHLRPLVAAVMAAGKHATVLELGTGFYSRAVLEPLCRGVSGRVISLDNNAKWLELCGGGVHCPDWKLPEVILNGINDVILVDAAPAEARVDLILQLLKRSLGGVYVLHDADAQYDYMYQYQMVVPMFKHRILWDKLHPATMLLSNSPLDAVERLL